MKAAEVKAGLVNKRKYMVTQLDQYSTGSMSHTACQTSTRQGSTYPPTHHDNSHKGKKIRSKAGVKYAATKLYDKAAGALLLHGQGGAGGPHLPSAAVGTEGEH